MFLIANKLGIGYKAVSEIMSIKSKMETPISLDDFGDSGMRPPVSDGTSVEQQVENNEIRRLVARAAEKAANQCGDLRLSADDYINLITGMSSYTEVAASTHISLKPYLRQKVDEFIEYFRNTDEVIRLEIADYTKRSAAIENLEDVIDSMPIAAVLSVSNESADAYMDELTGSLFSDLVVMVE